MDTFSGLELKEIPLSSGWSRNLRDSFLKSQGLRAEAADYAVAIYDSEDNVVGTASLSGKVITCVAVAPEHRDSALANTLVSAVLDEAMRRGITAPMVFTKPEYKGVFTDLGFSLIGETTQALLLEYGKENIERYESYLRKERKEGKRTGCIVMHCNPLTLGHRYLIEKAASQVDHLFVIPVGEEESMFSYEERRSMMIEAAKDYGNVTVLEGSRYAISRGTFPTYFLKKVTDATDVQILLDLDIFTNRIAQTLGVSVRFAGSEPEDELTARYNSIMRAQLPPAGVELVEILRLESEGRPVSASGVRRLLENGRASEALRLLPAALHPVILGFAASEALIKEARLTPKPGLVDSADNGAHDDMDLDLMVKSARTLRQSFIDIARYAIAGNKDWSVLSKIGVEGERRMLVATKGVNTHRGALFSLGLAVASIANLLSEDKELSAENVSEGIKRIAVNFPRPEGTHGAGAVRSYGIPGALDNAVAGYPLVFSLLDETDPLKVLLLSMASLQDTNIYYRCGPEVAEEVRERARILAGDYRADDLESMNREFISRRISPGGSADMLALWIFLKNFIH